MLFGIRVYPGLHACGMRLGAPDLASQPASSGLAPLVGHGFQPWLTDAPLPMPLPWLLSPFQRACAFSRLQAPRAGEPPVPPRSIRPQEDRHPVLRIPLAADAGEDLLGDFLRRQALAPRQLLL